MATRYPTTAANIRDFLGYGQTGTNRVVTPGTSGHSLRNPDGSKATSYSTSGIDPMWAMEKYEGPRPGGSQSVTNPTFGEPNINGAASGGTGGSSGGSNIFSQASGGIGDAMDLIRGEGDENFSPPNVQAYGYDPALMERQAQISAGQLANTDLSPYMSQHTTNLVDMLFGDIDRQRQMTMNDVGAQAQAAGAFGGSRHGLLEAETNRQYADQAADMATRMRQAAFENAMQRAQYDIGNRMAADQFNIGNDMQGQMYNTDLRFNTDVANQNAVNNQRSQYAQGRTQASAANAANSIAALQSRTQAALGLGSLGQTAMNMGNSMNQQLANAGGMQQGMAQNIIGGANDNFGTYGNWPTQSAGNVTSVAGGLPNMGSTSTSNPGLLGTIAGLGTLFG